MSVEMMNESEGIPHWTNKVALWRGLQNAINDGIVFCWPIETPSGLWLYPTVDGFNTVEQEGEYGWKDYGRYRGDVLVKRDGRPVAAHEIEASQLVTGRKIADAHRLGIDIVLHGGNGRPFAKGGVGGDQPRIFVAPQNRHKVRMFNRAVADAYQRLCAAPDPVGSISQRGSGPFQRLTDVEGCYPAVLEINGREAPRVAGRTIRPDTMYGLLTVLLYLTFKQSTDPGVREMAVRHRKNFTEAMAYSQSRPQVWCRALPAVWLGKPLPQVEIKYDLGSAE